MITPSFQEAEAAAEETGSGLDEVGRRSLCWSRACQGRRLRQEGSAVCVPAGLNRL